jgi:tRNA pseudouridine55 synthase
VTRPDGLLLVDKPHGITSHDAVALVRRALGTRKVGHAGTLDPMATGLLLLCAGSAARLQGFFTLMDKTYEGTMRLGRATTTYDREGEPIGPDRDASHVTDARVAQEAVAFRGEFLQSPPAYSAKKVGGRKFYEMARKGESVPSVPKTVRVTRFDVGPVAGGAVPFTISCSSGTYIRSIAHELGERLGCGAHLETLRRTRIGTFSADDALPLERFEALPESDRLAGTHAVPLARVPFPFPRVQLASLEAWKIRRGQAVPARGVEAAEGDWVALVGPTNDMVALGQVNPIGNRGVALIRPRIVLEP